jgi:hypothetical protein
LSQEQVTFSRIKEREQAYIQFFSNLIADLKKNDEFKDLELSPSGRSYITIDTLKGPDNKRLTLLGFSFTRRGDFRIEFYIDSGDSKRNEAIFNTLLQDKNLIEEKVIYPIEWEKLEERRASRIATYLDGFINDEEHQLDVLRETAVLVMLRFFRVFHGDLRDLIFKAR